MPAAAHSPCPSEPVATRTHGTRGVGWPSSGLVRQPQRQQVVVDRAGLLEHGPQDRRRVALRQHEHVGVCAARVLVSKRISSKNSTDTMSAQDMHVVGWPEPASVVISSEWRRSFCAIFLRAALSTAILKRFLLADCGRRD
jgi:hypothetical protein